MKKVLAMNFRTGLGKSMRVTVDDPRVDVTGTEVKEAMDLIISKGIFNIEEGLSEIAGATITSTETHVLVLE